MKKYNQLLTRISKEYSISRGKNENENSWKTRIIYSLLGQMALASLFDIDEDEEISVVHLKRRVNDVLHSYIDMYDEISNNFPIERSEIAEEIYEIYLKTGVIYHSPHRVKLATKSESVQNEIKFTRGHSLEEKQMISGLGTYNIVSHYDSETLVEEMFLLENGTLEEKWRMYSRTKQWQEYDSDSKIDYLKTTPSFSRGYWVDKPDKNAISILRVGPRGMQTYYLYKYEGETLFVSQLPQWQVEDYNYRSIANARLAADGVLPPTVYKYDGDIVHISFGYLPPPAELNLWKLYSWPKNCYSFPSDFNRICSRKVFEALKEVMSHQGYRFKEEE